MPISSWLHLTGPQYCPLHSPEISLHRAGGPFQPHFFLGIHQDSAQRGLGTAAKLIFMCHENILHEQIVIGKGGMVFNLKKGDLDQIEGIIFLV